MAATTITLKNVPTELHRSLKESAKRNKRSLNQEALHFLETALLTSIRNEGMSLRRPPSPARVEKIFVSPDELNSRADDLIGRGV